MTVSIRDDFGGTLGTNFVGRVPNVSSTGEAWTNLSLGTNGDWYEYQTQGDSSMAAVYLSGDAGGALGDLKIASSGIGGIVVTGNVRATDGASSLSHRASTGAVRIDIECDTGDTVSIQLRATDALCSYPHGNGSNASSGTTTTQGEVGSVMEFSITWADGNVIVNKGGVEILNEPTIRTGTDDEVVNPGGEIWLRTRLANDNSMEYIEIAGTDAATEGLGAMLIKNTRIETTVNTITEGGTPYQPAVAGYYSNRTMNVCGWKYNGPGHFIYVQDPFSYEVTAQWISEGPGGDTATWVCSVQTVPVYNPPRPAVPATPPTTRSEVEYNTGYNLGWNSGARSIAFAAGDGYVEFSLGPSNVGAIVGMNIDDGTPVTYNGNTIDFGVYGSRGHAWVIRNGVLGTSLGAYTDATVFRITRTDDDIAYTVDGVSAATVSNAAATDEFWLEAALYSGNDRVMLPSISGDDDGGDVTSTIAASLPPMFGLMTQGEHTEITGVLSYLTSELSNGLLAPSYTLINAMLAPLGGGLFTLTGELAHIAVSFRPVVSTMADHRYADMFVELPPMDGLFLALEGNERASFSGAGSASGDISAVTFMVASFHSQASIASVMSATIMLSAEMLSVATMESLLSFTSIQRAIMMSVARTSDLAQVPEGDVETWVFNLEGEQGTTQYTNYDFNSYAEIGGRFFGATSDGLVLLDGETDRGTPIRSVVGLGKQDGGSSLVKTWEQCYIGMSAAGNLFVKVIGQGSEYIYKTRSFSSEMQQQRVTFGKGLRTNYVTLEIYNEDGKDFEIDTVEFVVADLTRKIRS